MNEDYELLRETRGLANDKIMTNRAIESEKKIWADKLRGSVGQDMKDVLSGKKKIKLSFKERFNYKVRYYKNKIKKWLNKDEEQFI